MGYRIGLIALQALGAISILPYPAILVANVMSIASEREGKLWRVPFLLLSLYPLVWIGLDKLAWKMFGAGAIGMAYGLSSVPVVLSLAGVIAFLQWEARDRKR